ncbi:hypothetical protein AB1Y20_016148 [Prymnesium parvum]|uniref:Uncharacterized protein n=1 Tax=Prymnesium parvum TaxID=97485 RepID=A0AB34K2S2_PRYPA|mmetsp:Transcript_30150/g.45516  ORF Transcript_30150/g.45516 Transcript_30150/m.45516 type:complete len:215 (+) Transcript_30150:31-675(+)
MRLPSPPAQMRSAALPHGVHAATRALFTAALAGSLSFASVSPCLALGPKDTQIGLTVIAYREVDCPPELAQGRAGGSLGSGAGGAGIAQKCVAVQARVSNGSGKLVKDAGVFGVVSEAATGMSVLGNGQDGKNDSGQFAMIPTIEPGTSDVEFIFVSQQADDCVPTRKTKCPVQGSKPLVDLKFEKMKAIAYPGGDRYRLYDECEQNEFAEGCS